MASYKDLDLYPAGADAPGQRGWIAAHLIALRADLARQVLGDRRPNSLVIGSWNIRAFDGGRPRLDESYHYIAEIIDHFDICAVQELKADLAPVRRLAGLLGPNWDYFVTDVTMGGPGNSERMAFFYNTNVVVFRNLIGEVVLPEELRIEGRQIARTPFFASFQASWFRFTLCSAHIHFGSEAAADLTLRAREVGTIAGILAERARREDEVYVLLGDMNIESPADAIMGALRATGFDAPLLGPTNLSGTKHFDQIAFSGNHDRTRMLRYGRVDWRDAVFRADEAGAYRAVAEDGRGAPYADWDGFYPRWCTHEMSDHLPVWIELESDYSDAYLRRFIPGAAP